MDSEKTNKKLDAFIEKARSVHGEKYDYSEVVYINAHTDIKINCSIHGQFLQRPNAHIGQKQGCKACGMARRIHPGNKTTILFVKQAQDKWGNTYNYSITSYKNKKTKIQYTCKKHGVIDQKPTLHLRSGCPYCNGRGISKHNNQSFINLAKAVHNGFYDYSKVMLNKITDYVTITCPKHGDFDQQAKNHIHLKNGCPRCDIEKTSS